MPLQERSSNRGGAISSSTVAKGSKAMTGGGGGGSVFARVETRRLPNSPSCYSWAQRGADSYTVPHIYLSVYTALYQAPEPMPASIRCVPDTIIFCANGPTTWFAFDDRKRKVEPHAAKHTTAANITMYFREVMKSRELLDLSRGVSSTGADDGSDAGGGPRTSGAPRFPCAVWIFDGIDVEAQDRHYDEDRHVCVEYLDLSGVQALVDRLVSGVHPPHGVLQEFVAIETPSLTGTSEEMLLTFNAFNPGGGNALAAASNKQQQDGSQQQLSLAAQAEIFSKYSGANVPLDLTSVHKFRNLHVPRTDNLAAVVVSPGAGNKKEQQQQHLKSTTIINTHSFIAIPPIATVCRTISGLGADYLQCLVRDNQDTFLEVRQSQPGWSVTVATSPLLPSSTAISDTVSLATSILTALSRDRDRFADGLITPLTRCTLWLKPLPDGKSFAFLGVTHIRMPSIRLDFRMIDEDKIVLEGNANFAAAVAAEQSAATAAAAAEMRRLEARKSEKQQQQQQQQSKSRVSMGAGRTSSPASRPAAAATPRIRSSSPPVTRSPRGGSAAAAAAAASGGGGSGVRRSDLDVQMRRQPPATVQQNVDRLFERSTSPVRGGRATSMPTAESMSHQQLPPRPISATAHGRLPHRPMSATLSATRPGTPTAGVLQHFQPQQQQQQQQQQQHDNGGRSSVPMVAGIAMATSVAHHHPQPQYPGGFHGNPSAHGTAAAAAAPPLAQQRSQAVVSARPQSATFNPYEVRLSNRTPTPTMQEHQHHHHQQQHQQHQFPLNPPTRGATPTFVGDSGNYNYNDRQHQPQRHATPTNNNNMHLRQQQQQQQQMAGATPAMIPYLAPEQQQQLQQLRLQQQHSRIQYVYFPAVVEREQIGQRAAAIVDARPPSQVDRPNETMCPNCSLWTLTDGTFPTSYYAIALATRHHQKKNERALKHVFPRKNQFSSQRKANSIDDVRNANSGAVLFSDEFEWAPLPHVLRSVNVDMDAIIEHGNVWRQRYVNLCENCAALFWLPETTAQINQMQQEQAERALAGRVSSGSMLMRGEEAIDLSMRAASPEQAVGGHTGMDADALLLARRPMRPFSAAHSQTAARNAIHEAPPVASCFSNVTDALVMTDLQRAHRDIRQARRDKYAMRLVAADCHRGVDVFSANLAKQREIESLLCTFVLPPQDQIGVDAQIDDPLSLVLSRELHAAVTKVCREPPELALGVVVSRPSKGKGPWRIPRPVVDEKTGAFRVDDGIGHSGAGRGGRRSGSGHNEPDGLVDVPRAIGDGPSSLFPGETAAAAENENNINYPSMEDFIIGASSPSAEKRKKLRRETTDELCARRNNSRDKAYRALIGGSQTFAEMNENERAAVITFLGGDEGMDE